MDATDQQHDAPPGSRVWGWLVFAVVAGATLAWAVISGQNRSAPNNGPGVGQTLKHLHLQPLTGDAQTVSLATLKGRVTVLNFWGTWCPPCIREFPHLVALAKELGDREDFQFLPVSCGGGNDEQLDELRSTTEEFLQARGVDLPVYADQYAGSRRGLMMLFAPEQFAYPTTVVLDRNGRIRASWVGYLPHYVDQMKDAVQKVLDEPAS